MAHGEYGGDGAIPAAIAGAAVPSAARILVGTSGWSYKHWRGVFYPERLPQRDWLRFYARHFPTVELNTSFYHTPRAASMAQWREAAGPAFVFAVKANRYITHTKRLKDPAEPMEHEMRTVEPLGDALGPILLQLPPTLERDLERLDGLLAALTRGRRFALEFRHPSWHDPEVARRLRERGVAVCLHDWRGRAWPLEAADDGAAFVYVRMHGPTGSYTGRYDQRALARWAGRCRDWRAAGRDVYVYFNNDAGGNAIADATTLRRLLGEAPERTLLQAG
jgi:uncharacterized protein YecE (DUF72 family)